MKFTQRLVATFSVILACLVSCGLWVLAPEYSWAQINKNNVPTPELTDQIPINPSKDSIVLYGQEKAFSEFAWQAFVSLNWPANCQGEPLQDKQIGEAPSAPRVWEFYNSPDEIFLPNAQNPRPIPPVVPPACQTGKERVQPLGLRLTEAAGVLAKASEQEIALRTDILLPSRKSLIDQSGNYVINE
ncbi:MAG: hypothetical protein F6K24_55415, partial [Okeania sp. SIO2D1]|nr:hypothetical protein [Okeania sp. SIO2D1]